MDISVDFVLLTYVVEVFFSFFFFFTFFRPFLKVCSRSVLPEAMSDFAMIFYTLMESGYVSVGQVDAILPEI